VLRYPSQAPSPRGLFLQILRLVEKKAYVLLRDRRKRRWIWVILVTLASIQSYFVRELLVALLFFTVLYVILAAAVVLYILFVDLLDRGILWLESFGRSVVSLAHHHFASPATLPSPTKDRTLHGIQKLGPG
jgi:hypothetical protein